MCAARARSYDQLWNSRAREFARKRENVDTVRSHRLCWNWIKSRLHTDEFPMNSRTDAGAIKETDVPEIVRRKSARACAYTSSVVRIRVRGKVYRPANPVGTVPLLFSLLDRTSIRMSSNFRIRGWANISRTAEPRLRLGSDGEAAADRREDKFVPQLRRDTACRSKSCLLGISSSSTSFLSSLRRRYKTINR